MTDVNERNAYDMITHHTYHTYHLDNYGVDLEVEDDWLMERRYELHI